MIETNGVHELRLVVTAADYDDARELEAAGATVIAEPRRTPWNSLNSRLAGPAELQLTLFTELGE